MDFGAVYLKHLRAFVALPPGFADCRYWNCQAQRTLFGLKSYWHRLLNLKKCKERTVLVRGSLSCAINLESDHVLSTRPETACHPSSVSFGRLSSGSIPWADCAQDWCWDLCFWADWGASPWQQAQAISPPRGSSKMTSRASRGSSLLAWIHLWPCITCLLIVKRWL